MTKQQAVQQILPIIENHQWDYADEAAARAWFGKSYLGHGLLRCSYCQENVTTFKSWIADHKCIECTEALAELEGRAS